MNSKMTVVQLRLEDGSTIPYDTEFGRWTTINNQLEHLDLCVGEVTLDIQTIDNIDIDTYKFLLDRLCRFDAYISRLAYVAAARKNIDNRMEHYQEFFETRDTTSVIGYKSDLVDPKLPIELRHRLTLGCKDYYSHRIVIRGFDTTVTAARVEELLESKGFTNVVRAEVVVNYFCNTTTTGEGGSASVDVLVHFEDAIEDLAAFNGLCYDREGERGDTKLHIERSSYELETTIGVEAVNDPTDEASNNAPDDEFSIFDDIYAVYKNYNSYSEDARSVFYTVCSCSSFMDDQTALVALTELLANAIDDHLSDTVANVDAVRKLCSQPDDLTHEQKYEWIVEHLKILPSSLVN